MYIIYAREAKFICITYARKSKTYVHNVSNKKLYTQLIL
jgi:hypothetical protein